MTASLAIARPPSRYRALARFVRRPAAVGGIILALAAAVAVFGPMIAADPNAMAPARRLQFFSLEHPFGTDGLGRDLFARVVHGCGISLFVGFVVASAATAIGLAIGLATGYFRLVDLVVMRVMDGMMAIPTLLLAVGLASLADASLGLVILALTIPDIPRVVRVTRTEVLSLRERLYVTAAIASGSGSLKILFRHIVPNLMAPLSVQVTYLCAAAILAEAGLSFIGAGMPPETPSWGVIIAENREYLQSAPWTIFVPGLFLTITVLAISLIGDAFRSRSDGR